MSLELQFLQKPPKEELFQKTECQVFPLPLMASASGIQEFFLDLQKRQNSNKRALLKSKTGSRI